MDTFPESLSRVLAEMEYMRVLAEMEYMRVSRIGAHHPAIHALQSQTQLCSSSAMPRNGDGIMSRHGNGIHPHQYPISQFDSKQQQVQAGIHPHQYSAPSAQPGIHPHQYPISQFDNHPKSCKQQVQAGIHLHQNSVSSAAPPFHIYQYQVGSSVMPWNGNGGHLLHPHGSVSRDGNGSHPSHQSTMQVDCYNSSLLPASNENNIKQLSGIQSAFQCTSSLPTSFPPNYDAPPPIASNLIGNSAFPTSIFPLGICDKSSIASGQRETRNRRLNIVKEKRSNSVTRPKKPVNRVRNPEKILHSTIENKRDNSGKMFRTLFQKKLQYSDVGILRRMVIPKKDAEDHLPSLDIMRPSLVMEVEDMTLPYMWRLRYRYWSNNNSRMYVFENTSEFVNGHGLTVGDSMSLLKDEMGRLFIKGKKKEEANHFQNHIESNEEEDDANHSPNHIEGKNEDHANHSQNHIESKNDANHSPNHIEGKNEDYANHSQNHIEGKNEDEANHSQE